MCRCIVYFVLALISMCTSIGDVSSLFTPQVMKVDLNGGKDTHELWNEWSSGCHVFVGTELWESCCYSSFTIVVSKTSLSARSNLCEAWNSLSLSGYARESFVCQHGSRSNFDPDPLARTPKRYGTSPRHHSSGLALDDGLQLGPEEWAMDDRDFCAN